MAACPGTSGSQRVSLKVLAGAPAGLEVPLVKATTTFGQPGIAAVSIAHRRDGYYVSRIDGSKPCTLNGLAIRTEAVQLADRDVREVAEAGLEFVLASR